MNSKFKTTFFIAALIFSGLAFGALDKVESVLELRYSQFNLPAHEADKVTVELCELCNELSLQVNRGTVYRVGGFDGEAVTLQQFNAVIRRANRKELLFFLGYAPDTNIVTRLIVKGEDMSGVALSSGPARQRDSQGE